MMSEFPEYGAEDRLFAAVYLLLGYGFIELFTGIQETWGFSAFTAVYAAAVLLYLWAKGHKPSMESWFWFAVMLAIGIPFAFWTVLYVFQVPILMAVAAYWTWSASGRLMAGQTSRWVFFDGWNALAAVPFCNFSCQARVLLGKTREGKRKSVPGSVLLGFVLAIPALVIILPLLSSADAGFERLAGDLVRSIREHLLGVFWRMVFAVPVSCYLYGLIFGGISGRKTDVVRPEWLEEAEKQLKRLPDAAACTMLCMVCLVYVLFVGIQGNYLFSAFAGSLPQDFTYAEYARRGFFELCQIGAWNLIFLGLAELFSQSGSRGHRGLSLLAALLSVLTLLLIATAMSKMAMYISAYGLTVNRILPMVFMIWLALVFVSVILSRKVTFPAARICIMAGAVLLCLLCVLPVEAWAQMYNARVQR